MIMTHCNCEHVRHDHAVRCDDLPPNLYPRDGHADRAVPAGHRSALYVGEVCNTCAATCVREYLIPLDTTGPAWHRTPVVDQGVTDTAILVRYPSGDEVPMGVSRDLTAARLAEIIGREDGFLVLGIIRH